MTTKIVSADIKDGTIAVGDLAFDPATQAELDAHTSDATAAHAASAISADSTTLVGTGTDVQAVLEELDNSVAAAAVATRSLTAGDGLSGGGDLSADRTFTVNVDGTTIETSGDALRIKDGGVTAAKVAADVATQAELDAHTGDTSAAHAASAISADSTTLVGVGTDVQAVLEELDDSVAAAVPKSLFDANTVLAADSDNTPAALTMGASTILARLAAGNIVAATPAELRTLLALVIGTNVQAFDADLSALAGLTSAADKLPYFTGAATAALADLTAAGRAILDDSDAAAQRVTLGVPALTDNKSLTTQPAIANTETVVISYTCAANELAVGTTFRFKAFATRAGTNSSSPVIRIRVGTTTLTGNIAATLTPPANALAVGNVIEGLVTVITSGAGGTIRGSLINQVHLAAVTIQPAVSSTAAVAVNTTTANMLIELTFISGNASNTYTFQNATLEKVVA